MTPEHRSPARTADTPPLLKRRAAFFWLLPVLLFIGADVLGLFDGLNIRFYDAFFRARGIRLSRRTLLSSESMTGVSRLSPLALDRNIYAQVIDTLGEASAVAST
jgi:CHASE2 domain-containing sensor protein